MVTGAASGIGRATTLHLAELGANVVAVSRSGTALRSLAEANPRIMTEPVDVTDAEALKDVAAGAVRKFGRLDGWVSNAAVNVYGTFGEVPLSQHRRVVESNLIGTMHSAAACLPWMRDQGRGVIVNVGSVLSKVPAPLQSAYVASKYGIRGFSDALRLELHDVRKLDVVLVLPGPIDTPIFRQAGNHTGWSITPPQPTIDADRVARAIVSGLVRPRNEIAVGMSALPGLAGMRLSPALTKSVAGPLLHHAHLGNKPKPATEGNLFMPSGVDTVSGGWPPVHKPKRKRQMAAGVAVVAAAAAAYARGRRRRRLEDR